MKTRKVPVLTKRQKQLHSEIGDGRFSMKAAVETFKDLPELCYEPFEISDEVLAELRRRYAPKNPDATTEWL